MKEELIMKNPGMEGGSGPGTVVGVNVALSGTLKDQNDIVIYGMVEGQVISERSVNVGETAQVKGPIHGQLITVSGTARGSIDASERLEITETGKVFGDIATKDLVIHSGATLVGKVSMGVDDEAGSSKAREEVVEVPAAPSQDDELKNETETSLTPDEE